MTVDKSLLSDSDVKKHDLWSNHSDDKPSSKFFKKYLMDPTE